MPEINEQAEAQVSGSGTGTTGGKKHIIVDPITRIEGHLRIEAIIDENNKIVDAFVPLSEMFGYSTDLRSATQGRATYSMEFDHYEEVPRNVAEEIIKKRNA